MDLKYVEANESQAEIINAVKRLEYAAVDDFLNVTAVKIGKRVAEHCFSGNVPTKWKTTLHDILPVIIVDGYEIGLVTESL